LLKSLKPNKPVFMDTTFLLPFFRVNIEVEGFSLDKFESFLTKISKLHFSELSIFEAKAKIFRLSRENKAYTPALEDFGKNLTVLRGDERFIFHPYTGQDDRFFNSISAKDLALDSFDMIILAQALNIGLLVTEDEEILRIRDREEFVKDPTLRTLKIKRWKELEI